jgi:non-ribosomal peptide synthetase component F
LREWNATARAVPGATLPELFAAQVARTPEADAVVFEDERLSYGELDARSSRLAHHLRGLGVGPEVVVGLCIERSLEMLVGLLGILKAGGAYLPLDPNYPRERLAFMLADTGISLLVTQQRLVSVLPEGQAKVVRIADTLSLVNLDVSEAYRAALSRREDLETSGEPREMQFDSSDNLPPPRVV